MTILNYELRPLLSEWHPKLDLYLQKRDTSVSSTEHEANWESNKELRDRLKETQKVLKEYSAILARVAKVDLLYDR